jgi:hypothetical protein
MIIDSNISCLGKAQFLKSKGVTVVGRYYRKSTHPEWAITKAEARELSKQRIQIFTVFEEYGKASDLTLTKAQGAADGQSALDQATAIGQPHGSAIYFAVEGLPDGYKSGDLPAIRNYFSGVKSSIGTKYTLGVYADGLVCGTLLDEHICKFTWLAAASTAFDGTCKFFGGKTPLWDLAQVPPLDLEDDWNGLSVDINLSNPRRNDGDFGAFLVPVP